MESLCSDLQTISKILSPQPFLLAFLILMILARTTADSSPVFPRSLLGHVVMSVRLNCKKVPMQYSLVPRTPQCICLMAELTTIVCCLFFLPGIQAARVLGFFVKICMVIFGKADLLTVQHDGFQPQKRAKDWPALWCPYRTSKLHSLSLFFSLASPGLLRYEIVPWSLSSYSSLQETKLSPKTIKCLHFACIFGTCLEDE